MELLMQRFMVISLPVCLIQGIRIVGYGKTCAQAGEALFNGDYKTTGCVTGHGNGSAMRSPIGIIFQKLQMQIW
jgi:ADP-ribosylglycohydrolase